MSQQHDFTSLAADMQAQSLARKDRLQTIRTAAGQGRKQAEAARVEAKSGQAGLQAMVALTRIPGFYPTPRPIINRMIELAEIEPGMTILEPEAGRGDIADALRVMFPLNPLSVIECHHVLRQILQAKGFHLVGQDFLEFTSQTFDRIIMNPPFENGQDMRHITYALSLLAPGGRLVSVCAEGAFFNKTQQPTEFRQIINRHGWDEKLPTGSFRTSARPTGVNTRLVILDRPE